VNLWNCACTVAASIKSRNISRTESGRSEEACAEREAAKGTAEARAPACATPVWWPERLGRLLGLAAVLIELATAS
jgi:hypothetical protein